MTPVQPELYDYYFDRAAIVDMRKKLGLNQAKLAELLDVPVNTLSRWEANATTPDADSLAAIYAIAKQSGFSLNFFRKKESMTKASKQRTKIVLAWDFQNLGLKVEDIEDEWGYMKEYLDLLFPATRANRVLRVYGSSQPYGFIYNTQAALGSNSTMQTTFEKLNFQVFEGYFDADSQLIRDSSQDCLKNPEKIIFVLVSKDGDYTEFLKELKQMGVEVYIWSDIDEISERLEASVEDNYLIPWDRPYVVINCIEIIKELEGKPVKKGPFGQQCRERLDEDGIYPQDVGFSSRRNPYGNLLTWLESQGIVEVRTVKEPDLISIKLKR